MRVAAEVARLADHAHRRLLARLAGRDDAEFLWEPVPGRGPIREVDDVWRGEGGRDGNEFSAADAAPSRTAAHAGRPPRVPGGPVGPGIELTSTYHQGGEVVYGREDNETWRAFEAAVGGLEGGTAVAFASGIAAVAAVFASLPVGARVAVPGTASHGTRGFVADRADRPTVVDDAATADLVWVETPSNPTLEVTDIAGVVAQARGPVVVDNTFATPLVQRP